MRTHSVLLPAFWTGPTGKGITAAGKDARILATYLLTSDHSNMIGLYRLPQLYATEETGLKRREILGAIEQLTSLEFAQYDEGTEFVWVREMARIQLALMPREALKEEDKRVKGVVALYKHLPSNPFLGPFFDRYVDALRLPVRRDFRSERNLLQSPLDGASKPLGRGPIPDPDLIPDYIRKGEAGETIKPASHHETRRGMKIPLPASFMISDDLWEWTVKKQYSREFVECEFEKFCNRNKAKGEKYADWEAAFRNWLIKAPEFAADRNGHRSIPTNGHSHQTCTKRVQAPGDRFLRSCGQPASPAGRPSEPRCTEHLGEATRTKELTHAH